MINSRKYEGQKVAHKFEGKTFSRLTVVKRLENHVTVGGTKFSKWLCRCVCGNEIPVIGIDLKSGKTQSCGCLHDECSKKHGEANLDHGGYSNQSSLDFRIRYRALQSLKYRAKKRGYDSDLELDDLPILTDICPVLGITYEKYRPGKTKDASPSIDRKNPNLPYLKKYKENLCFVSYRANRIKQNATVDELQKIINYMGDFKSSLIDSKPSQK